VTLRNWLARHAQNAVGALGTLSRNPIGTAMTVAVIGIALALPAALNSLVQAGRAVAGNWEEVRDFSVYLGPDVPIARAQELARELGKAEGVASVRIITADEALATLSARPGFEGALEALEGNPLPHTLVVRPSATLAAEPLRDLGVRIQAMPGVELVKLDLDWVQRLNAGLDFLRRLGWLAAVLLGTAVIIIVGNTIRLDIQNRADEIEVAKLLGATDAFVRRPFLYLGLWYGLLGGVLAALILLVCLWALRAPLETLAGLYGTQLTLGTPGALSIPLILAGGLLAGWGGAWTAVARHLSVIQPRV
jgi:cell division transport system permease protein